MIITDKTSTTLPRIVGNWYSSSSEPKWSQLTQIARFCLLKILVGKTGVAMNIEIKNENGTFWIGPFPDTMQFILNNIKVPGDPQDISAKGKK